MRKGERTKRRRRSGKNEEGKRGEGAKTKRRRRGKTRKKTGEESKEGELL